MQPASSATYTYSGNILAGMTKNNVSQTGIGISANGEQRIGNYVGSYDSAGRRKTDSSLTASFYNYMNYTHKNERGAKADVTNGSLTYVVQYIYDEQSHLVGEYDKTGVKTEYIWLGDKPVVAIYSSGNTARIYYIVTDAQNTPRRLIDSGTQAVAWSWDSTAFGLGAPTGTETFNLRFPGQYFDAATGQFYNHNRYYNPELGRYMEADPIGLDGGLNPYAYAGGNPVMNVDPSGLKLNMLDDAGMSAMNIQINNQLWLNQQQTMIEKASANIGRGISYNGTGTKDYVIYNSSPSNFSASAKDVKKLQGVFSDTLDMMTNSNMRNKNGYINNLVATVNSFSFGKVGYSYLGCIDQSGVMADQLSRIRTEDKWTFTPTRVTLYDWNPVGEFMKSIPAPHVRVIGTSSNPNDPRLIIDPWRNTFKEIKRR